MEQIRLNDVGLGYRQCSDLNDLVTKSGETLLDEMSGTINSLKAHWIGSDATTHINNLIVVRDALGALLADAKEVTSSAGDSIIAVQTVIRSNGGAGEVGTELNRAIKEIVAIAKAAETNEFNVDPAAADDYNKLVDECSKFDSFVSDFESKREELMANWTAGANIEDAKSKFQKFSENSETYKKYMNDAKENLSIAVSNISKLG